MLLIITDWKSAWCSPRPWTRQVDPTWSPSESSSTCQWPKLERYLKGCDQLVSLENQTNFLFLLRIANRNMKINERDRDPQPVSVFDLRNDQCTAFIPNGLLMYKESRGSVLLQFVPIISGGSRLETFLPHGMTQDPWMIDCSTVGKRWVNRSTKETILLNALLLQSPRFRKIVHRIATKLPSTSGQFLLFHSIKGTAIRIDCFGLGRRRLSAGVKIAPKDWKGGFHFVCRRKDKILNRFVVQQCPVSGTQLSTTKSLHKCSHCCELCERKVCETKITCSMIDKLVIHTPTTTW